MSRFDTIGFTASQVWCRLLYALLLLIPFRSLSILNGQQQYDLEIFIMSLGYQAYADKDLFPREIQSRMAFSGWFLILVFIILPGVEFLTKLVFGGLH